MPTPWTGPMSLVWECEECWDEQSGINHSAGDKPVRGWDHPPSSATCYACGRDGMLNAVKVKRYLDGPLPESAYAR